ncbi:hypothetical protein OG927_35915 (plasmid) [Streptomyces clavifer]|uniref:hypothetical protein n=1 Tax=Streptomyces clavifer TaxID=68188 RepID=UPI002E81BE63|nr:hypothetical protein [Streptomyces clavifer]WUC32716.1 hypothetical protein OG927_35915 [Streptomyces clavifer]
MGKKPVVAVSTATIESAMSDTTTVTMSGRFAMPHALVIIASIVTAAFLAPDAMTVEDVLLLLGGAGGIGAAVVLLVVTGGRSGGRIGRFVRAYFSSGR